VASLNSAAKHVKQNVAMFVVGKGDPEVMNNWRNKEGWNDIWVLSSGKNTYNEDYHAEDNDKKSMKFLGG